MRFIAATISALAWACVGPARAADPFDAPPPQTPSTSLSASQISGPDFHIQDPVSSDGLMHHYVVESRFGNFQAYGQAALEVRLREVAALTTIANTSDSHVVLESVARGIQDDAKTVKQLATHPVGVVLGIPKGITHLLGGYGAQAQEATHKAKEALHGGKADGSSGSQTDASHLGSQATHYAADYARRYLGITAAERLWYAKLQVDPYTHNEVLRKAIQRLAKVDGAASFGMRFAPIGVPFAGEARRALDTLYNEDPAVLRKRRHQTLAADGLNEAEIEKFENSLLLTPTIQTVLVDDVTALAGVKGRAELLRHASTVTSEDEIEVFLESTRLLMAFHARQPVSRILSGVRLPTAQLSDGRVAVFGAFDAVYWTQDVARYCSELRSALAADRVPGVDVWLLGTASTRARRELASLGWTVHEQAANSAAGAPYPWEERLQGNAIVLLGEVHDNATVHRLRLGVLTRAVARGWRPAIAMEQFDREHQPDIERARLQRPADADYLIAQASPSVKGKPGSGWNWQYYRPYVALALEYHLPLLAANLSRSDAAKIVEQGYTSVFQNPQLKSLGLGGEPEGLMKSQEHEIDIGHCHKLPEDQWPAMARAQLARDAVMSEVLRDHSSEGVVLLAGDGHVRRDIGVARWFDPATRARAFAVGFVERDTDDPPTSAFDTVVTVDPAARDDPCASLARPL
ncbi:MAG TPA: ChaN family lipoprotein [Steroidobacteraceae bacterium]|jgi:uncharacterized iron-regulated protein